MTKIKIKSAKGRSKRVQFSMSDTLWALYDANKKLAASLRAEIDYSDDFEKWFRRVSEQVSIDLAKYAAQAEVSAEVVTLEGGADHGTD